MTRQMFADLLLVAMLLACALCIARGFLTDSPDLFLRAGLIALLGGLMRFVLAREMQEQEAITDDSAR